MIENTNETSVNSNEANTKSTLDIVVDGINYAFVRDCLLKPLDDIMVSKEITTMNELKDKSGKVLKDEDGNIQYDTVKEIKEVPSAFKKGIVLKVPHGFDEAQSLFKVGDTVVYYANTTREFDLFKDTVLIQQFNIVAVVNE